MGRKLSSLDWERLISEQRQSGEKVGAFCERHGLARSTFSVKKKELSLGWTPISVQKLPVYKLGSSSSLGGVGGYPHVDNLD